MLLHALQESAHAVEDFGLQLRDVGGREELGHCAAAGAVGFPAGGADGGAIVAERAVEPGVFVELVVGVEGVEEGGVVYVDLPRGDADDGALGGGLARWGWIEEDLGSLGNTILLVKLLDMESILPMLDTVEVELIPTRNGRELGPGNLRQRVEHEAEKRKAEGVSSNREDEGGEEGGGGHRVEIETPCRFMDMTLSNSTVSLLLLLSTSIPWTHD